MSAPSRRGLLTASAWSVPAVVVASAAPAYAASPGAESCVEADYLADWGNGTYQRSGGAGTLVAHPTSSLGPAAASSTPLVVTVAHAFTGTMQGAAASDGAANLQVSPFTVGGTRDRGLTLMQRLSTGRPPASGRRGHAQVVTLAFDRPVRGLRFTITDVDSASDQYRDRVELSGAPRVLVPGTLAGRGTATDPLANRSDHALYDPAKDGRGNVVVTYDGEVRQVVVTFWNDHPPRRGGSRLVADGQQGIFLGSLSFSASTC